LPAFFISNKGYPLPMIFTGIFYCKGGLYEQEIPSPHERTALAFTPSHLISLWKGGRTLQEEIESKTVTLAITTTKLTARCQQEWSTWLNS
jgi:hypothetical protein